MGSYRPDYSRRDNPPPPPPPDMPPLLWGPPPSSRPYQFGTGRQQLEYDESGIMQQTGFSFHANDHAPQYPHSHDAYHRSYADEQRDAQNEYRLSQAKRDGRDDQRRHPNRAQRGDRGHRGTYRGKPTFHPSSRPLLLASGGESPERKSETSDSLVEAQRFRNADELSESDEATMNESEDLSDTSVADAEEHEPASESNGLPTETGTQSNSVQVGDDNLHGQTNVIEASTSAISSKAESVPPKWSNPEYFTVLPPPDDSLRKKKDVVKLIRKARVALTKADDPSSQVVANDDYISFDFDEAQPNVNVKIDHTLGKIVGQGVPGAPSGPSQSNGHAFRLHNPSNVAPGTEHRIPIAAQLGPPPAISSSVIPITTTVETVVARQKRKRDSDEEDDVFIPRPPKKAKGRGVFSNGRILDEWRINHAKNPVPWLSIGSHLPTENSGLRLHQEICDFYSFVKPQEYEQTIRTDTLQRIREAIQQIEPECDLRCFGSFAAGLYLPNSDMDLVVISRKFMTTGRPSVFQRPSSMHNLGTHLIRCGIADINSLEVISKAKVPIVKFVDQTTSLKVDISFENDSGLVANDTFQQWQEEFPAMPILVTLMKQFLMMRGLNEVAQGGIGGFSVTCLVVSLLQNLPRVQCGELVPEQHLGEILLEFLDFYGNQLDISQTGLSMNPPGYFNKRHLSAKWDRLAIMDPNNPQNDISGGSRHILVVFAAFSECHEEILRAMRTLGNKSLLGWMLGGNYNSILWQRQRLRRLYKERYGSGMRGLDSIRGTLQQGSQYVGSEPERGHSNFERLEDSKASPQDLASPFWSHQLRELKDIARTYHLVGYARMATPTGNRALHESILEKEQELMEELVACEKKTTIAKRKIRGKTERLKVKEVHIQSNATIHALRRQILKTWNPADPTPGKKLKSKTLENARKTYERFYVLLQRNLNANPQPGWQEATFGKAGQGQLMTKSIGSEGGLSTIEQQSSRALVKQESQPASLGSLEEHDQRILDAESGHSGSAHLSLTRQGSSTQDAIMID